MFWKITAFGRKEAKVAKGTSTHQDLSFAPTPTSIRPWSVTRRDSLENLMFRKTAVLDILAKFCHFRRSILAKIVKKAHLLDYRPRPFIWAYSQVFTTIRYKETAWKSSFFEKPLFWTFWPKSAIFSGQFWPKLSKSTSTGQGLSYEPIPRSLRPSVTKKTAWKGIDDGRTDGRTDTPNL